MHAYPVEIRFRHVFGRVAHPVGERQASAHLHHRLVGPAHEVVAHLRPQIAVGAVVPQSQNPY